MGNGNGGNESREKSRGIKVRRPTVFGYLTVTDD